MDIWKILSIGVIRHVTKAIPSLYLPSIPLFDWTLRPSLRPDHASCMAATRNGGQGVFAGTRIFQALSLPEKFGWKIPLPGVSMAAHFRHGRDGGSLLEILAFLRHGI